MKKLPMPQQQIQSHSMLSQNELDFSCRKRSMEDILDFLTNNDLSNIRVLNLGSNDMGDYWAQKLAETKVLNKMSNLRTLILRNNKMGATGIRELVQSFQRMQKLTGLDLDNNNIREDGAIALAQALQLFPNLLYLRLSFNFIGEVGIKELAGNLRYIPKINSLILSVNKIGATGVKELAASIKYTSQFANLSDLTTIDLWANNIRDDGAIALASVLKYTNIAALHLTENNITDIGAQAIASSFIPNLQIVDLKCNHISDTGGRMLAYKLNKNKCLKSLDLRFNHISDNEKNTIKALFATREGLDLAL